MDPHTEPHWDRCALITIDVQEDFVTGTMPVSGAGEILPALSRLTSAFRAAERPVFHAVRLYLVDGSNADLCRRGALQSGQVIVRPGSKGSELVRTLAPAFAARLDPDSLLAGEVQSLGPDEFALYKPRWNAFFGTSLKERLADRDVDTVVIAGLNYPNCPRATAFGASERDMRSVLASDAVSGFTSSAAVEMEHIGVHSLMAAEIVSALSAAV